MKIVFICDGNVARSQEAELYFNGLKQDVHDVATSAGVNVNVSKPIDPTVIEVMSEVGINMDNCRRKQLTESFLKDVDIIVSFKPAEELPAYVAKRQNVSYWDVPDPRYENIDFHRKVRDNIKIRIKQLID
jgi:protein-tyrosine-phosphatase